MIFFKLLSWLLTLTCLFVKPSSSLVQNSLRAKEDLQYRLSDDIQPIHYDLTLTLGEKFFEDEIFSGILDVIIKVQNETNSITLHANELNFSSVTLLYENETEIESLKKIEVNNKTDIFTLSTSDTLKSDTFYKLHFDYTGKLRTDDMHGFYISKYTENNQDKYLATTQFQSIYARRAFPCFDEPKFRATFNITINHPSYLNALGNTPRTLVNDTKTTFEKTPPMSTYLVAFIVSEFTCEESTNNSYLLEDITHQICSRQKTTSSRKLALDIGPKILNKLEGFTGIKYSASTIPKLDQVAIPDFAAGAMENWGLATYRETALLWDINESSNRYKQRVETVIAHELAHMWFGDLVTTHWWSDTFLNEGFATYFEYFITAEVEKNWELDKQFVIEQMHPVLQSDALTTSEPLSQEVSTPTEVQARFSSISYNKGGSIFRMVEHFMGKEKFKQGLNKYLNDNKFGNTKPEDLWKALQIYSTLATPLATVMHNWVNKPGYPLLLVDNVNSDIIITQQRFIVSNEEVTSNYTEKWYVPVSYTLSTEDNKFKNTLPRAWLKPSDSNLTLEDIIKSETDWIVFNNQQTGYYRVSYSKNLLQRISDALEKPGFDGIHELNRAQLIDDLYNLARAGLKTYSEFLDFISFLRKDTSYFSWYSTITAFSGMLHRTESEEIRLKLSNYLFDLIQVFYNQVPFNANKDDNQIYTHKKVLALNWACSLEISDCIKNSLALFNEYKSNNSVKPNKNLRAIVYCNGLRHSISPNEDWDFLWNEFITTDLATEQATILTALGCVRDSMILTKYLNKSIDVNSRIRPQDALSVFSAVYGGNRDGVDIAAEFFYKHYKRISEYYGTMNSMTSLIIGLTNRFTNQKQINKLKDFVDKEDLNLDLKKAAKIAYENALINLEITKKLENQLKNYFKTVAGATSKFELNFIILLVSPLWMMIMTFNF